MNLIFFLSTLLALQPGHTQSADDLCKVYTILPKSSDVDLDYNKFRIEVVYDDFSNKEHATETKSIDSSSPTFIQLKDFVNQNTKTQINDNWLIYSGDLKRQDYKRTKKLNLYYDKFLIAPITKRGNLLVEFDDELFLKPKENLYIIFYLVAKSQEMIEDYRKIKAMNATGVYNYLMPLVNADLNRLSIQLKNSAKILNITKKNGILYDMSNIKQALIRNEANDIRNTINDVIFNYSVIQSILILEKIKVENNDLTDKVTALEKDITDLNAKKTSLSSENANLQDEVKKLKDTISDYNSKITKANDEVVKLKDDLSKATKSDASGDSTNKKDDKWKWNWNYVIIGAVISIIVVAGIMIYILTSK